MPTPSQPYCLCAATVNMSKKLFFTKLNRNSCSFFSPTFSGLLPVSKNTFLCCIFQMFKCCFPYKLFYQHNNFNQLLNADNIICNENVENVKHKFSHFGPQSRYRKRCAKDEEISPLITHSSGMVFNIPSCVVAWFKGL